jgi:hypothetical protein
MKNRELSVWFCRTITLDYLTNIFLLGQFPRGSG